MTDDPFEPGAGKKGKRDGMKRAAEHADPEWQRVMLICVKEVAFRQPYFNTDAVEKWRLRHYPNHTTHEKRALGPIIKEAAKLGYCERTDGWHESQEKSNHSRPKRRWFSLIYRGKGRYRRPPPDRSPDPRQFDLFA